MRDSDDTDTCETCGTTTDRTGAVCRETMGGLDPDRWQTLCCPECGARLKPFSSGNDILLGVNAEVSTRLGVG